MKTYTTTMEATVSQILTETEDAYNLHRDATDRLYIAQHELAEARKNENLLQWENNNESIND